MRDAIDAALVRATQAGLPLVPRPYRAVAEAIGIGEGEVIARLAAMRDDGRLRRIAAVPNHYALGYRHNAMTVWDVDDGEVDALGRAVGALDFVTHCYRRPRRLPDWPYNLFAMVHGKTRAEAEAKTASIRELIGARLRAHDALYSTRILKKSGMRLP